MQLTSPQRGVGALVLEAFLLPLGVETSQFRNGNRQRNSYVTASFGLGLLGGTSEPPVWWLGQNPCPLPPVEGPLAALICEDHNMKCVENGKCNTPSEKKPSTGGAQRCQLDPGSSCTVSCGGRQQWRVCLHPPAQGLHCHWKTFLGQGVSVNITVFVVVSKIKRKSESLKT